MGMGARMMDKTTSKLPSPQQAAASMLPLLINGLKRELAGMLLRQWDLGHATTHLEGSDVASSVPTFDDRHGMTTPSGRHGGSSGSSGGMNGGMSNGVGGGMGGEHLTPSYGDHKKSGSDSMSGSHLRNLSESSSGGGGGGGGGSGGTNGSSRRHASSTEGDQMTASYTLVPPDGTNVMSHVLEPGHAWEVRVRVGEEQSIVWEFRSAPAEKTLFSFRFNGSLMFPEAMLASQAPNVGSIRRVEAGTYSLLFRHAGTKRNDRPVDIWCSVRSPSETDMMERREYVRSGR